MLQLLQQGTCLVRLKGPQSVLSQFLDDLFSSEACVQVRQKVQELRGTVDVLLQGYQSLSDLQPSGTALAIATTAQGWSDDYTQSQIASLRERPPIVLTKNFAHR